MQISISLYLLGKSRLNIYIFKCIFSIKFFSYFSFINILRAQQYLLKLKVHLLNDSAIPQKRISIYVHKKTRIKMLIKALFTIAQDWKEPRSTGELIHCDIVMQLKTIQQSKKKELSVHVTTWMNLIGF